jgi:hypothetical protein
MVVATSIELIKNLVDLEYGGQKFDLHNDYECARILFENKTLLLLMKRVESNESLSLFFFEVNLTSVDFFNETKVENLTLDTLYRGRCLVDTELIDQSLDGKGFFYVEFYEGQKMEFWSKGFSVELK